MPVLLELLPALTDPRLVAAAAAHLRRPWARGAFSPLVEAYRRWAPRSGDAGSQLGDALARAARMDDLPVLLDLVRDARYGSARQMIIHALWRFRKSPLVEPALVSLLADPAVALHAMSALRRSIGPAAALPYLRQVAADHPGDQLGKTAASQIRRADFPPAAAAAWLDRRCDRKMAGRQRHEPRARSRRAAATWRAMLSPRCLTP